MGQLISGGWSTEQSDALREFVLGGFSFAQSAVKINEKFGTRYTRNGAIGRAHRIGLSAPTKLKEPPKPRKHQLYRPRPKLVAPAQFDRCEVLPGNVSLLELADNGCRYPTDDRSPFVFCNSPQRDGSSYCPEHYLASTRHEYRVSEEERERRRRFALSGHPEGNIRIIDEPAEQ